MRLVCSVVAFKVALIVTGVCVSTPEVVTLNVAVLCPAATVTVFGTDAVVAPLNKDTTTPEGPAWPSNVTVPVDDVPPGTDVGLTLTAESGAGVIVRTAF